MKLNKAQWLILIVTGYAVAMFLTTVGAIIIADIIHKL